MREAARREALSMAARRMAERLANQSGSAPPSWKFASPPDADDDDEGRGAPVALAAATVPLGQAAAPATGWRGEPKFTANGDEGAVALAGTTGRDEEGEKGTEAAAAAAAAEEEEDDDEEILPTAGGGKSLEGVDGPALLLLLLLNDPAFD
jgi:hypothetical protein